MDSSSNSSLNSTWIPDGVVSGSLISSIIMGLCCVLGFPGNIAVLVVILRRSSRRLNFTLCLMLNLASSDILCLATVPMWIYHILHAWILGCAACNLATFLLLFSLCCNMLTVTLFGVHRYLQVLYPQMLNRLGRKGEAVLLLALWGLACALTALAVATRDVVDGELKCQRHTGSDAERVAVLVLENVLWFVVPFSVLVTSYCCLHRRVDQTALFSSAKMTRLVTSVVVAFFILWIPVHIVNMVDITYIVQQTSLPELSVALRYHRNTAARVARCFMVFNCCLDPFLYAFALRRIREQPKSS
ncbi:atypical chemokine receptor 2-like [Oncorhynchus tshawytscha]|uniref:atypical chemokine receptor 2-like n=1 Tax=Oncorhynchus tshawytscha TaxID=74940 RepID=UPI000D09E772|nr:atypical chemokine receptor 2-like [Oncorhynchus tshawytscha]